MPLPSATLDLLARNLASVRAEIAAACSAAGRSPDEVQLVAITKYVDARVMRGLYEVGCRVFGENRGDALREKRECLSDLPIEWHFVGHLQRNKIKWVLPGIHLIQSVDSRRLLEALQEQAVERQVTCRILLEVNLADEAQKTGMPVADARSLATQAGEFSHLQFAGLMGMAGLDSTAEEVERQFRSLQMLGQELAVRRSAKDSWDQLSMGMSGDFPAAIAAGATLVRIGSRLFQGLE